MSDRLHDTLTGLRTDVDRAALADSTAVRARGNQRTRRQAIGTSLAVVALVAGVIGVSGALTGTDQSAELPADQTTSAPPTADPTVETRPAIDTSLLLAVADLPHVTVQTFSVGETVDSATSADAAERSLTVCGAGPSGGPSPDLALLRTFPSDLDAFMWQWVAQYATGDEAAEAVNDLRQGCGAAGAATVDLAALPTEAEAGGFRASEFSADPDSEFNGEIAAVARIDDTVVVLSLRGMLRETEVDMPAFDATVIRVAEQLAAR